MEASVSGHIESIAWGGPAEYACFVDQILERARTSPHACAVDDADSSLTYGELANWVWGIAAALRRNAVGPGDIVGVAVPRSGAAVASFLAVTLIGATYLPLDPAYPAKRLAYMVSDSGAVVLLQTAAAPRVATDVPRIHIEEIGSTDTDEPTELLSTRPHCAPDRPVYVIYTSGSTGWPKGVALPHRCVDNMANWQMAHSVRPDVRTAQFAPLNFDVFFQELLGTLCGGGSLVIVPEDIRRDPFALWEWLAENHIERLFLPYVALHMLAVASAGFDVGRSALVEVNTAGEQMVCTPAIKALFERLPACRLSNHYGQSESAMVSAHILSEPVPAWPSLAPIGRPLPGCELLIDAADAADPYTGELLVAGAPLSLGYLGRDELNRAKYIPLAPTAHGHDRAFRTGDLVRYDGEVVHFITRLEDEVKIRGVRVNPLETEAWLLEQPGVLEAACVVEDNGPGRRTLAAAVTADAAADRPDPTAILARLQEVLPDVAVPKLLVVLGELPRTPSGKIDRAEIAAEIRGATTAATGGR
ncbi:AMP-binding protein [Nocardia brasiliensis]|uniref:AMP-binding protein n=2 Tax=Nocardia brasiliensis TaxID=37326 RepID=A0A6G9Y3G8_NOCBR|nr:AMP-binding protein [Nocardia brasiliensis]